MGGVLIINIVIRRLEEVDAEIVAKIICRNLLEVNTRDYQQEEMEYLTKVYDKDKVLEMNNWAHSYVACFDNRVVGCGSIASFWGKEDESILLTVFVLPELHGKGIGGQIINALEKDKYFFRAKRIEIPSSITACDFYRKFGYNYKNGVRELDDEKHYRLEKFRSLV